jgi:protocatechuate 3,4-dioxygenase beta subunit
MDCSPNVVRMQIHRGLDRLKKLLPQSLLTGFSGIWWSRRALASVRGQLLAKAGVLPEAALPSIFLVGGLVVFNKILLVTVCTVLLIGTSLYILWDDNTPASPSQGDEASYNTTREDDLAQHHDPGNQPAREVEVILPQADETASPREQATIKGRVFDYRGNPVPGVRILAGKEEVLSDSAGAFELPSDRVEESLDVALPHVLVRCGRQLEEESMLLVVTRNVDLLGMVIDEERVPVAGARVDVRPVRLVDFPEILDRTRRPISFPPTYTDEQGRFELHHLPGGCAMLRMEKRGYQVQSFPVSPEPTGNQYFTLKAMDSEVMVLTGWVEDHLQRAVPEALIGFGKLQTRSDEWGAFRIEYRREDLPERGARLYAAKPGYRTKEIPGFGSGLEEHVEMVIRFDGPALCISGTLLDAEGTPIQGSVVMPWGEEYLDLANLLTAEDMAVAGDQAGPGDIERWTVPPGSRAYSRTNAKGAFLVGGLNDRTYRLRIFHRELGIAMTTAPIRAGTRNVKIRIPADAYRVVSGFVLDRHGEPIPEAEVRISFRRWENSEDNYWDDHMKSTRTDEDGSFKLAKVFRLDTLFLNVNGEKICPFKKRFEPEDCTEGITLIVERRCYFKVELSDPLLAQSFRLLDQNGERLEITEHTGTGGTRSFRKTPFPLRAGKSEVVSASSRACTLQLLGKKEVQMPVRLNPGEITVLRY